MDILIATFFGLLIGSFLNVCIYRVPLKLSVTEPARSFCPVCGTQLSWYENIPVFSWLFLKGKCKHCGAKISGQYPLVEILSAAFAAGSFLTFHDLLTATLVYALSATLIVITFIDLEHKIIPNAISYPGMIIGFIFGVVSEFTSGIMLYPFTQGALDSLLGFLLGGGFFYVIGEGYYLVTKRDGLGGGDIKMMGMTGAILGWKSIAPTIFIGSVAGAIIGVAIMILTGAGKRLEIPFGPWLSLGVIIYIFGDLPFFRF